PSVRATVIDGPQLPLSQYTLVDEHGTRVPARAMRSFAEGTDDVAIALVVQGSEVMMGNNTYVEDDRPDWYFGYWSALSDGLVAMDLAHTLPSGSRAMLVVYGDRAHVRAGMGRVDRLS